MAAEARVMYLILRSDLISLPNWTLGAVFTQIAHASTACLWTFRDDPDVVAYMEDMDHMRKVTLKVGRRSCMQEFLGLFRRSAYD